MIGDGYSDYVTREAGVADKYFAYTENVKRERTTKNADYIAPNFDDRNTSLTSAIPIISSLISGSSKPDSFCLT